MKLISPYVHGMLDYITFITLLMLPLTLMMNGRAEFILIGFALFEFILAVVTRYPLGATRQVPVHGVIDLLSGLALIAAPWVLGFSGLHVERNFYVVLGLIFLVVWALTDFKGDVTQAGTELVA